MKLIKYFLAVSVIFSGSFAHADFYQKERSYTVSITNITKGVYFTPVLAASHSRFLKTFTIGEEASDEIGAMAEGGDVAPLSELIYQSGLANTVTQSTGLLGPGETVDLQLTAGRWDVLSIAAMLLPTNDTFVALQGKRFPFRGGITYLASAYDAGTETNTETCATIPGPQCGGSPFSPEDAGEGYVYPAPGIHGEADLSVKAYQWQGPVAKIVVRAN